MEFVEMEHKLLKSVENELQNCSPSDRVEMSLSDVRYLAQRLGIREAGSDIFFSKTVPLKDCVISLNDGKNTETARVFIYPETHGEWVEGVEGSYALVGFLVFYLNGGVVSVPLGISKGVDYLDINTMVGFHNTGGDLAFLNSYKDHFYKIFQIILGAWYIVQILLLNPKTEILFANPTPKKYQDVTAKGKERKRSTKYIRKHVLKASDIEKALSTGEKGQINRKTLAWYVIGHWRHYKNGHSVFVDGYWKGVLRDAKRNFDEGRNRIIDIPNQNKEETA